ncbi:isoprenylcysteine carboxylmethyltransferase family protein [Fulvimarina endophytica]|uniref:Isoprenylcysteine carboxylmethyltransferase family protein n=1 Tax=Fulvimarina endophytica TaxID=2293836 RepID=A0A371X7T8_9HYPH|nr:methyltransferase [Fulvimarina endophytica]RFC65276.1 isoprenylcysteine carboxylmethyltransferase family protein [Fulvimarina endophytica]
MLTTVVILAAIVPLASFTWALRQHFRSTGGMPTGMRGLTAASGLVALLFLALVIDGGVSGPRAFAFLILSALSTSLFWWTVKTTRRRPPQVAYSSAAPDSLYDEGPYAFVRHPFYLAYCLFWLGTAVAAGSFQWFAGLFIISWYVVIARTEEASFLGTSMAESYLRYKRRTGMIVPKFSRIPPW